MDLKSILPSTEKENQEHYWVLLIEPGWVQAGIWKISNEQAEVVFSSTPNAWELEEELIQAADAALSSSIQSFPEEIKEPSKTVFGVVSSWVSKGEIKKEYIQKIKRICSDLSLEPAGFVVLSEAIAHLKKSEEGSPLNAVLLGISKEHIELSLFRLGKLTGTSLVSRSVSIVDDVTEGLTRFADGDPFPSRFILYNGKEGELEEVQQSLIKVNWDEFEKLKFLHSPKLEMVTPKMKVNAVALAGASEIADISSMVSKEDMQGKDIKEERGEEKQEGQLENVSSEDESVSAEDLGFVLGKDVVVTKNDQKIERVDEEVFYKEADKEKFESAPRVESKNVSEGKRKKMISLKKFIPLGHFAKLKDKLVNLIPKRSKEQRTKTASGKKPLIIGATILLSITIGVFLLWWFYPKADVFIYVSPQKLEEKVILKVDPNAQEPDIALGVIPGEVLVESVSDDRTKSTTGTKTVGEKAKGEITLYRVGPELTLSSGTSLTGASGLKFNLDEDVNLASGSAGTPGITKTKVTAEDIGAQYNLASGSTFSVSNYSTSDIEGKNDSSFSGGTSREISAVSEDDMDDLEEELKDELKDMAKKSLTENISMDKYFIEESLLATTSSLDFSNEAGDEASTLKLSLTLDVSAISVDKDVLSKITREVLKDKVPDGFVIRDEQIDVDFEYKGESDGIYELEPSIIVNLLPEIDPDEIAQKIIGKYPKLAIQYLTKEVPGFVRTEITLKPRLPGRLGTLPHIAKNIEVEIAAEK